MWHGIFFHDRKGQSQFFSVWVICAVHVCGCSLSSESQQCGKDYFGINLVDDLHKGSELQLSFFVSHNDSSI